MRTSDWLVSVPLLVIGYVLWCVMWIMIARDLRGDKRGRMR